MPDNREEISRLMRALRRLERPYHVPAEVMQELVSGLIDDQEAIDFFLQHIEACPDCKHSFNVARAMLSNAEVEASALKDYAALQAIASQAAESVMKSISLQSRRPALLNNIRAVIRNLGRSLSPPYPVLQPVPAFRDSEPQESLPADAAITVEIAPGLQLSLWVFESRVFVREIEGTRYEYVLKTGDTLRVGAPHASMPGCVEFVHSLPPSVPVRVHGCVMDDGIVALEFVPSAGVRETDPDR